MASKRKAAQEVARMEAPNWWWIDHAAIDHSDIAWLANAQFLTLWNVTIPPGFLRKLPKLWWLDLRGGSIANGSFLSEAENLQLLRLNQTRGLVDLDFLRSFSRLRYLDLYGLSKVKNIPSLAKLNDLERVCLGQMISLNSFGGALDAPNLRELLLLRKIPVSASDESRITSHPSLSHFDWVAEDVPVKTWKPVRDRIKLERPKWCHPDEWFEKFTHGPRVKVPQGNA